MTAVLDSIPRLMAHDFFADGATLHARVPTPWGERRVHLSTNVQPLLAVIDGKKNVSDIAAQLRLATQETIADKALIDLFVALRRLRVVALTPKEKTRLD